jgi:uncharacterized protein (TIGR02117 family)
MIKQRRWRWLLWALSSLGILAGGLTIAALTPRQWGVQSPSGNCQHTIYVIGDQMHTNLIVPIQTPSFDWGRVLKPERSGPDPTRPSTNATPYLIFGWGDRIFYTETPSWDQVNWTNALRALVLQNSAALFVKEVAELPNTHEQLKCVRLGDRDYQSLMQFLTDSFQRDDRGQLVPIKGTQLAQGKFYAATGKYSALRTCNSWTADGLRVANVNTPIWGGLAPAVLRQVRNGCTCPPLR